MSGLNKREGVGKPYHQGGDKEMARIEVINLILNLFAQGMDFEEAYLTWCCHLRKDS